MSKLDLKLLVRPNILNLTPYRCARDDYSEGVLLDANECSYGSCIALEGDMHRYPSPYNLDLKEKIAKYRGVRKDQIFLGVGSDEAIDMVVRVFCTPGEGSLLITPPTYGMYKVVADINNIKVISVPLSEEFHLQPEKTLPGGGHFGALNITNTAKDIAEQKVDGTPSPQCIVLV